MYDPKLMKAAVKAAENARGKCSPNPYVGALVVRNGSILATGWTQQYGSDHAEVNALKKIDFQATNAEMYVTLEPCAHHGKTPPCTQSIISSGIKRVFIGITDPNPLVAGKGIQQLQDAGIEVQYGFMQEVIAAQLESYLVYITQRRPFVLWKTALSLDGKFRAEDGSSRWITNSLSRRYVHRLRSEADVVLTGVNTVINDDPQLNVRLGTKAYFRDPARAILDPALHIPLDSKIVATLSQQKTYIFHTSEADPARQELLSLFGAELITVECREHELDLRAVLGELYQRKYTLVMLECGDILSSAFWRQQLIDKCILFYGNVILGGKQSMLGCLELPAIRDALTIDRIKARKLRGNIMISGYPLYR